MLNSIKDYLRIKAVKVSLALDKTKVFTESDGKLVHKTKFPLIKICIGKGIDVGCGSDKICPEVIGIDIVGKGEIGKYGCEKNKISDADVKSSGDNLPMFEDCSLDYVVSRDNIEHYVDFLKALKEWNRVLKKRGKLGITTPDEDCINSLKLDPSHKHAFNLESLKTALNLTGFKVIESGETIRGWGFYVIAEKIK
ncbi:MAG: class I SAM-dependent methyltransferase [Candidatus Nanoarchaeia archaeon]|nr:class I SAM-dependent methyltransferase [Candidatus Nanoarchaeia archaeon]